MRFNNKLAVHRTRPKPKHLMSSDNIDFGGNQKSRGLSHPVAAQCLVWAAIGRWFAAHSCARAKKRTDEATEKVDRLRSDTKPLQQNRAFSLAAHRAKKYGSESGAIAGWPEYEKKAHGGPGVFRMVFSGVLAEMSTFLNFLSSMEASSSWRSDSAFNKRNHQW